MSDDRLPLFGVPKRVIAYQLSLLGDAPKPCHNWRRPYYTIRFFGGMQFPLMDDEIRQNILLRADSMSEGR